MRVDVSIVVFRSRLDLLASTLRGLAENGDEIRTLWVLVSGVSSPDLGAHVESEVRQHDVPFEVEVFERPDNLGFAGGHNWLAGLAFSSGAVGVVVLNPDVWLGPGALRGLIRSVKISAKKPSIHGPLLLGGPRPTSADGLIGSGGRGARYIDSAGIKWTWDGRHFDYRQGEIPQAPAGDVWAADGVSGAVLLIDRESYRAIIARTGRLFDELFLAYREDAELGMRMQAVGGVCLIHDTGGFVHFRGSPNAVRASDTERLLGARNRFLMRAGLGGLRPGSPGGATLRDLMVLAGVVVIERKSMAGLRTAFRLRRTMRYRKRRLA